MPKCRKLAPNPYVFPSSLGVMWTALLSTPMHQAESALARVKIFEISKFLPKPSAKTNIDCMIPPTKPHADNPDGDLEKSIDITSHQDHGSIVKGDPIYVRPFSKPMPMSKAKRNRLILMKATNGARLILVRARNGRSWSWPPSSLVLHVYSFLFFLNVEIIWKPAFTASTYNIGFPSMIRDLNCTKLEATAGLSLYVVGFGVVPLVTASFSEEFGRHPLYIFSSFVFVLMYMAVAL